MKSMKVKENKLQALLQLNTIEIDRIERRLTLTHVC